jgi:hypothetical protein
MEKQKTQLKIPVPPVPILEQAVGYRNYLNARFLALWWEPCGDEAMVPDGLMTFTGLWPGYLAYMQHRAVHPQLVAYNLGLSENPAEYHLVIDLEERLAFIAPGKEAERLLTSQWGNPQEKPVAISSEEMEKWLADLSEQLSHFPSFEFFVQPGVEGAQGDVDVTQRFGRKRSRARVPSFRFVFGAHPGKIIGEVRRFYFGNVLIPDVIHPLVQIVFIGVNCALA